MSLDPLVIHGGMADPNPYAYVNGRPSQLIDPTGLDPTWDGSTVTMDPIYSGGTVPPQPTDAGPPPGAAAPQDTGPGLWGMANDLAMAPIAVPNAAMQAAIHGGTAAAFPAEQRRAGEFTQRKLIREVRRIARRGQIW